MKEKKVDTQILLQMLEIHVFYAILQSVVTFFQMLHFPHSVILCKKRNSTLAFSQFTIPLCIQIRIPERL